MKNEEKMDKKVNIWRLNTNKFVNLNENWEATKMQTKNGKFFGNDFYVASTLGTNVMLNSRGNEFLDWTRISLLFKASTDNNKQNQLN